MTQTAVICRWNSLSRQYKSESCVGNPLFPRHRLSKSGEARDRFVRGNRLIELGLGRIGFEETSRARQQKIEGRDALAEVQTPATGSQKEQCHQGGASQECSHGDHFRNCIFENLFSNLLMKTRPTPEVAKNLDRGPKAKSPSRYPCLSRRRTLRVERG